MKASAREDLWSRKEDNRALVIFVAQSPCFHKELHTCLFLEPGLEKTFEDSQDLWCREFTLAGDYIWHKIQ